MNSEKLNKPLKITYIRFTGEFNYENKDLIYNKINILNKKIEESSDIEEELINSDLLNIYSELYKSSLGFQLYCYIFIGDVSDEIKDILLKTQQDKLFSKNPDDIEKLNNYFGYNLEEELNINWAKYSNVEFIYSSILEDDSINSLKFTIFSRLSTEIPDKNDLLIPDNIFLTTYLEDEYMKLEKTSEELKVTPNMKIIQNMFYRIYKKPNKVFNKSISEELLSLGINNKIVTELLDKYSEKELNYENFVNNKIINLYITKLLKNPILTHFYEYSISKRELYLDNLIYQYFNLMYDGYNILLNNEERINPVNSQKVNTLISSVGKMLNKELYFYNFSNIHEIIIKNKLLFNLTKQEDINKYFNGFITKYFPNINHDNYQSKLGIKITDDKKFFDNLLDKKDKIYSLITSKQDYNNIPEIKISRSNNIYSKIEHNLNLPKQLNLLEIFNEIELNNEIPFVKFKDQNTKEIIYKIYKDITKKSNNNYLPDISKDTLSDWIKNVTYELSDDNTLGIKGNPKYLEYKIKLDEIKISDKLNEGKIYKINYLNDSTITIDILDLSTNFIIKNVNLKFIINDSNLKVGNSIQFYKFDKIYSNLEITKHGRLILSIYWKEYHNISWELINNLLIEKINYFVDKIKNLNFIRNHNRLVLNCNNSLIFLNEKFFNSKYIDTKNLINLELPKEVVLNYDRIKKLAEYFYNYISLESDIFHPDEIIEYYSNGEWSNSQSSFIYKIVNFSDKDKANYDISKIDDSKGINVEFIKDVKSRFIRRKGDTSNRKSINFIYRRVEDFNDMPPIKKRIHKLYKQNFSKKDILDKILENFMISSEIANKMIDEEVDSIKNDNNDISEIGLGIKIYYLDKIQLNDRINNYKIYIDGLLNIDQLKNIKIFLLSFFKTYTLINFPQLYISKSTNFNKLYREFLNELDLDVNRLIESNKILEQNEIVQQEKDLQDNSRFENFDEYLDLDNSDDDDDETEEIMEKKKIENLNRLEENLAGIGNKVEEELLDSDSELVEKGRKRDTNPILSKLYEKDKQLFIYEAGEGQRYADKCQGPRQPIVISEEEKQYIDINHPGSYQENKSDILCTQDTPTKLLDKGTTCSAIKWGSSPENQNWYICPKIFDLRENVSLLVEDLDFLGLGVNESGTDDIKSKKEYGEHYGKTFKSKSPNGRDWRLSEIEIWNSDKTSYYNPDILEFGPRYKGRKPNINRKSKSSNDTLIFETHKSGVYYVYPGFQTTPTGSWVPCCFSKSSTGVEMVYGKGKITGLSDSEYIQGSNKNLDASRLGLLKFPNLDIFFNEINTCKTGKLSELQKPCFLRYGINQSYNSFFSLIASYIDHPTIKNQQNRDKLLLEFSIGNLNEEKFKTLNKGNLEILFRDNLSTHISSYQNYLEYILSDQDKKEEHFMDLLTRPNPLLAGFQKGLILILIEENKTDFDLVCPYFMDTSWYNDSDDIPVAIALKRGFTYEPIFYFSKNKDHLRTFNKKNDKIDFIYNLMQERCNEINEKYQQINPLANKNKLEKSYDYETEILPQLLKISEPGYRKLRYITDNYNKVIAILLENYLIIPCNPYSFNYKTENEKMEKNSKIILEKTMSYFNINSNLENILKHPPYLVYKNLEEFKKKTKLDINIIRKIINENEEVIGLELGSGHIIPVMKGSSFVENEFSYNNLESFKGYSNIDKKLITYEFYVDNKYFSERNSLYTIIKNFQKMDLMYRDEEKKIEKIYILEKKYIGLMLKDGTYIEIEPSNISEIDENYLVYEGIKISNLEKIDTPIYYIDTYEEIIFKYLNLWQLSNYEIKCKPIRNIIKNNKLIGLLLEQGQLINLDSKNHFSIIDKDDNEYLINKIPETEFYIKINDIKPKLYESKYIDDRIRYIKKIDYKKKIYKLLKLTISSFLQNEDNLYLKNYLNNLVLSPEISLRQKRILLEYVLKKIFLIHAHDENILEDDFRKKNINFEIPCSSEINNKLNDLCTDKSKLIDSEELEPIDIKKVFYDLWGKLYPLELNILKNNDLLTKYLEENDLSIDSDNEKNIDTYMNHKYNEIIKSEKLNIKDLHKNMNEIVTVSNNIILNVNKDRSLYLSRYIIYTIVKNVHEKLNLTLYEIFLKNFTEELLRNKHKRRLILENISIDENANKYKVNDHYEILIYANDLYAGEISNLYSTIKKKYYSNINTFDNSNPFTINPLKESDLYIRELFKCEIGKIENVMYKISDNYKVNSNKSYASNKIILDSTSYNFIKDYLDKLNCYEKCEVGLNEVLRYKINEKIKRKLN